MANEKPIPIAVVGMSCRFPAGAKDPSAFWSMLVQGRSGWSTVPVDRFNEDTFCLKKGRSTIQHHGGHFLDQDIRTFDTNFFGISPSEATAVDPQQRLQLESAYEALEGAGITLESIRGSNTAVYMALFSRDYERMMFKDPSNTAKYHMTGVGDAILANRISYAFDLKGPSVALDTGCSGGLVALHQACQSLRTKESDMALVGGANLILSPDTMIPMSMASVLNPDGKCYPFDARGKGYGRGEGVATLVLKRLDDALNEGLSIRTIIRNSGVNQDGKTMGITVPNSSAQQSLITSVYASAGIDPTEVGYVEAHGTGTEVGDAAEMETLARVFHTVTGRALPLYVGSVKSNIGHLENVSGLAGLIKSVLILENAMIPPNFDLKKARKHSGWEEIGIKIARSCIPWPKRPEGARYASVNSFGYGGTNAHCIIEAPDCFHGKARSNFPVTNSNDEAQTTLESRNAVSPPLHPKGLPNDTLEQTASSGPSQQTTCAKLFAFSAKSEISLKNQRMVMAQHISKISRDRSTFTNLAYTLSTRRNSLTHRHCVVAADFVELKAGLEEDIKSFPKGDTNISLSFVFTGQGAQWFAMGADLIGRQAVFTTSLIKSASILKDLGTSWDLITELRCDAAISRINRSEFAQPCTTAIQIALVDLLASSDIRPKTVIGHSSGEIAAAYTAGALSQAAALKVAFHRGLISKNLARSSSSKGTMLALGLGQSDARHAITTVNSGHLTLACINSPNSTTISGDETAIVDLANKMEGSGSFSRRLNVDLPYHSDLLKSVASEYQLALQDLVCGSSKRSVDFISTVTAKTKNDGFNASYWAKNLTSTVQFEAALERYRTCEDQRSPSHTSIPKVLHILIELGPHRALSSAIRQTLSAHHSTFRYAYQPTLVRGQQAGRSLLGLYGKLFELGVKFNLGSVNLIGEQSQSPSFLHDLPCYQWDHSLQFWHESRVSIEHRNRQHPPHELLGLPIIGNVPSERVWSNFLSIDDQPWLQDHKVDSFVTYPGAAYLCMALEALRQVLSDSGRGEALDRYLFKSVKFIRALVIPDGNTKTEIQLKLKHTQLDSVRNNEGWWNFQVYSLQKNQTWSENCRGSIMMECSRTENDVEIFNEDELQAAAYREVLKRIESSSLHPVSPAQMYNSLALRGNGYGESFTLLQSIELGELDATGEVKVSDLTSNFIHPTTFDAVLHLIFPVFARRHSATSVVPVQAREVFVSGDFPRDPDSRIRVCANVCARGSQTFEATILAFDTNIISSPKPILALFGDFQAIGGVYEQPRDKESAKMAWNVEYDQHVDYLQRDWFESRKAKTASGTSIPAETKHMLLKQATARYIANCLGEVCIGSYEIRHSHMKYLFGWMKRYAVSKEFHDLLDSHFNLEELDKGALGVEGEALSRIGDNLVRILKSEENPLDLLLQDDLLYRIYGDDSTTLCCQRLIDYMEILTFQNPNITVLEIGAGTGGTTFPILEALSQMSSPRIKRYDFTDVAASFLEPARQLFKRWSHFMSFDLLDIERDPLGQGFRAGSYDLIIAANVIHATSSIADTLQNIRKLLKPGGKLALIEITTLVPYVNLIFGTLPGWWKGYQEGRTEGPQMTTKQWSDKLEQNLMSGVDLGIDDFDNDAKKTSLMISTAIDGQLSSRQRIVILAWDEGLFRCDVMIQEIASVLQSDDCQVTYSSWQGQQFQPDVVYLILDPISSPILQDASDRALDDLKRLLNGPNRVLWVVTSGGEAESLSFEAGLMTGLGRTARSENESLSLVTVDASRSPISDRKSLSKIISRIITKHFVTRGTVGDTAEDDEYVYADSKLTLPRLVPNVRVNAMLDARQGHPKVKHTLFHDHDKHLRLDLESFGLLDSLRFTTDNDTKPSLGADELEIHALAHGINFKDVFIALGQMPKTVAMAGECAGIVTAVGSNIREEFSLGDRVCAINAAPYASRPRVIGAYALKLPRHMTFSIAASIPIIFATAYHSLVDLAGLQKGQTLLIHAAAGGVGQAAIMTAQHIGAEIFVTVGSSSKRELIVRKYGIPETHIFSSRALNFKRGIRRITANKGVNVVLNSTSGQALLDSWECISNFGVFIEIGKTDIYRNSKLDMHPFDKNVTFSSVDMTLLGQEQPARCKTILRNVFNMFSKGYLRPISPITAMPMTSIGDAFRLIQSRGHMGKLILESNEDTVVKTIDEEKNISKLDPDGTYVVAGGLGSLGLRICRFLGHLGAGHLVILSRQTPDDGTQLVLDQIKDSGTKVLCLQCDITDTRQVNDAASICREKLPIVKGIIQGTMVLRDVVLEHMSAELLNGTVRCKTIGTTNLTNAFMDPVPEFFILLSSLAGIIGNRAQANYAAANTYLDYVAQSQERKGNRFTSINLGFIIDSETISNDSNRVGNISRAGCLPMTSEQVLSVLGRVMTVENQSCQTQQLALGLNGHSLLNGVSKASERAMFKHLRSYQENADISTNAAKPKVFKDILQLCNNRQEQCDVIVDALATQVSSIMALRIADLSLAIPLTELGLDSLAAVELKNWITRTLHAELQTSEVMDSFSIQHLGDLVTQRSRLILSVNDPQTAQHGSPSLSDRRTTPIPEAISLPDVPLPSLEHTLRLYKDSVKYFCSDADFERVQLHISDLMAEDSIGCKLQDRLENRKRGPNSEDWLWDLYNAHAHLRSRLAINPLQHFYCSQYDGPMQHSQAERAAILVKAALTFKSELRDGLIEPDRLHDKPLCMHTLEFLFNSAREPRNGMDKMQTYPDTNHLVVMKLGHYYQISLPRDSRNLPIAPLIRTIQLISDDTRQPGSSVAALTAADRNTWAEVRRIVQKASRANDELLRVIESAAFVISLDDEAPSNATQRYQTYLYGDPAKRWSDKSIQFVVCKNGTSAYICDHAALDGAALHQLNERITKAIHAYTPQNLNTTNGTDEMMITKCLLPRTFTSSKTIDKHIAQASRQHLSYKFPAEVLHHHVGVFGSKFLRSHQCAPKSGYQLLIQLASMRYFGYHTPSWESVSMRVFRKGRAGMYQAVLPSVAQFCTAMEDCHGPSKRGSQEHPTIQQHIQNNNSLRRLFNSAVRQHAALLTSVYQGQGFTHHLYALQEAVRKDEGEKVPSLFTDPVYSRVRPAKLMTDCAEWLEGIQEGGFAMSDPEFVLIHYEINEKGCDFIIYAPKGRAQELADKISDAARQVKDLLDST